MVSSKYQSFLKYSKLLGLILLAPLTELFLFREGVHYFLGRGNIRFGFYSFDALLGCCLVFCFYFVVLDQKEKFSLKFQKLNFLINLVFSAVIILALTQFHLWSVKFSPSIPPLVLLVSGLGCLLTSISFFISGKAWLTTARSNGILTLIFLISTSVLTVYPFLVGSEFDFLCPFIAKLVYGTLKVFHYPVILKFEYLGWSIIHPGFVAYISPACSGMEGMFFYSAIFFMFVGFNSEGWTIPKFLTFFILGLGMMLFLNVFRISLFLSVSYFLQKHVSSATTAQTFSTLFHANVGWIFYSIGIYFYLNFLNRKKAVSS